MVFLGLGMKQPTNLPDTIHCTVKKAATEKFTTAKLQKTWKFQPTCAITTLQASVISLVPIMDPICHSSGAPVCRVRSFLDRRVMASAECASQQKVLCLVGWCQHKTYED